MEWNELKERMNREPGDGPVVFTSDGTAFSVERVDADGQTLLSADLGALPEDASGDAVLREMLTANHMFAETGGASLSVDPGTTRASLQETLWLGLLDFDDFMLRLEAFAGTAKEWSRRIADARGRAGTGAGGDYTPLRGNEGFIAV